MWQRVGNGDSEAHNLYFSGALARHVRQPLARNAYTLSVSAGTNAILGMAYWLVAARTYSPEEVGLNAAVIGAMTLLATIGQLNLASVLIRFLPVAGARVRVLHRVCMTVTFLASLGVGSVFLLGLPWWSPELLGFREDPYLAGWFILTVALWSLFILNDGALIGLRRVGWVPAKSAVFGVAKLLLLVVPWVAAAKFGVFLAWTLPLVPLVAVLSFVVDRRLAAGQCAAGGDGQAVTRAVVTRFATADYGVVMATAGVANALPLLVLEVSGTAAAAYFALSWQIASAMSLVGTGVSTALVLEGAGDPERLAEHTWRATAQALALLTPIACVGVWITPLVLSVFGGDYAAQASTVLRYLIASAIPIAIFSIYSSVERVQRRMRRLLLVTVLTNATAVLASWIALDQFGLEGFGATWLAVKVAAAVIVSAWVLRPLWRAHIRTHARRSLRLSRPRA